MGKENGSLDLTIMRHLYLEPIREEELRGMDPKRRREIMNTIARLLRKALVVNIDKGSTEPIYKLTREGQRVLMNLMAQRTAMA